MTLRPSDHERSWKTVSIWKYYYITNHQTHNFTLSSLKLYHGEKEKLDAYWFGTSNPLPNGIEKLPLMVSQWPPVLPEWSNLVQFDFRPKHPVPARDSPLRRESSTKCAHGVVMHHTGGFQQSDQKAARWWWGWSQTRPIPRSPDGDNNRGMKSESVLA